MPHSVFGRHGQGPSWSGVLGLGAETSMYPTEAYISCSESVPVGGLEGFRLWGLAVSTQQGCKVQTQRSEQHEPELQTTACAVGSSTQTPGQRQSLHTSR